MTEEKISPFLEPTEERSFPIIVEKRKLYVHKELLIAISPVFERMLNGDFAEGNQGFVELKEKNFDDILELFEILLPITGTRKRISRENVEKMVSFADEYDIEQLRIDVRDFLRISVHELSIDDEICMQYANYAFQVGECLDVANRCMPFLCKIPFAKITETWSKNIAIAINHAKHKRIMACEHAFLPGNAYCQKCHSLAHGKWCTGIHVECCKYKYVPWYQETSPMCCCGYKIDESILNQKID